MFAADLLGRWTARCLDEVSPFNRMTQHHTCCEFYGTFSRKVFLVLCATGMGIGATIFSGIFWVTSHTDSWIFGSENFDELLSNNILVVFTLVLFVGSFQFGFGPMRYTLLGELFEPREQVGELFSWNKFRSSFFQETIGSLDHCTFWALGFAVTKLFLLLEDKFGLTTIFVGVAGVCMSSVLFTIVVIPETRVKVKALDKEARGSLNQGYVQWSCFSEYVVVFLAVHCTGQLNRWPCQSVSH